MMNSSPNGYPDMVLSKEVEIDIFQWLAVYFPCQSVGAQISIPYNNIGTGIVVKF